MVNTLADTENLIRRWAAVASSLRDHAIGLLDQGTLELGNSHLAQPHIFAAALLSRTIGNLRATFILIECGMVVEARTLTRCCIENLIWLRRLSTDGAAFVERIISDSNARDIAFANTILPLPLASFLEEDDVRLLQERAAQKRPKTISPSDQIADEEARADYLLFKMLSNDAAHPSARSLSWHVQRDPVEGRTEFHIEPRVTREGVQDIMYYSCGAVVKAMALYHLVVPRPGAERIIHQASQEVLAMGGLDDVPVRATDPTVA